MVNVSGVLEELVSTAEAGIFRPGADVLATYPTDVVVGWYRRLALATQESYAKSRPGGTSLSAAFLLHWQDPARISHDPAGNIVWNNDVKEFDVAALDGNKPLHDALLDQARPVFLSQRQRGQYANRGYGGAVRRLQEGWDGTPLTLTYLAGGIEGATNAVKGKLYLQLEVQHLPQSQIDWPTLDIYASLHIFAVESTVVIRATPDPADSKRFTINFDSWTWKAVDTYDWDDPDPDKHNDMPNPDVGKTPGPSTVRPDLEYFTVYHRNARRVEAAHLAAPFPVASTVHTETDPALLRSAVVHIDQKLDP
jgi:hypothetical protein